MATQHDTKRIYLRAILQEFSISPCCGLTFIFEHHFLLCLMRINKVSLKRRSAFGKLWKILNRARLMGCWKWKLNNANAIEGIRRRFVGSYHPGTLQRNQTSFMIEKKSINSHLQPWPDSNSFFYFSLEQWLLVNNAPKLFILAKNGR